MTLGAIVIYGIAMALCGIALVTWAIPAVRIAKDRRQITDRAFNAAFASLRRWGLGDKMALDAAKTIARDFGDRLILVGYVAANRELDLWIERAESTNDLLAMPVVDALAVVKKFKEIRFPHLRQRA